MEMNVKRIEADNSIQDYFFQCMESQQFVDTCLVAKSKDGATRKFFVHSLIFGAVSPLVKDVLVECPWKNVPFGQGTGDLLTIIFSDVQPSDMETMIEVIYKNDFSGRELTDDVVSLFKSLGIDLDHQMRIGVKQESGSFFEEDHEIIDDQSYYDNPEEYDESMMDRQYSEEMEEADEDQELDLVEIDPSQFPYLPRLLENMNKPEEFGCTICGQRLSTQKMLDKHKKVHDQLRGAGAGKCKKCGLYCHNKSEFDEHSLTHKDSDPFVCYLCHKEEPNPNALYKHVYYKHLKTKNIVCEICGVRFAYKHGLKFHMNTYHSEKPPSHSCEKCGKTFKTKGAVAIHVRSVHEKIFNIFCPHCSLPCRDNGKLNRHLSRKHKDLQK